jgi:acyl carrier protein|tara:strand:+ start:78 stop:323 length:246 start_codon:yes stop_codon:yes gene_type:complete
MTNSNKLYDILSRVFSISIEQISDDSGPEDIEKWDSFNALVLIDELESEFSIQFTISEITDVSTVSDIKRHLRNHGITLDD